MLATPLWKAMLGGSKTRYLLDDEFSDTHAAGAVNGTPATPGPGTRIAGAGGSLSGGSFVLSGAATDTLWLNNAIIRAFGQILIAKMTITDVSNTVEFGWDDNTAGAIGLHALRITGDTLKPYIGGAAGPTVFVPADATAYVLAIVLKATGAYYFIKGGTATTWRLLWIGNTLNTTPLYAGLANTDAAGTVDFLRSPQTLFTSLPIIAYDSFTRANGALGSTETVGPDGQGAAARVWTGATWTVSTNVAINTPTVTDATTDGGLEANYTAGLCDTLTKAGSPTVAQSADVHGGAKAQSFQGHAPGDRVIGPTIAGIAIGDWFSLSVWGKRTVGAASDVSLAQWSGSSSMRGPTITGAAYAQYTQVIRALAAGSGINNLARQQSAEANSDTVITDDYTQGILSLSTLFSSLQAGSSNVLVSVDITLLATASCPSGMVVCLDSSASPANFMIAYIFGDAINGYTCRLDKCVVGTYTNLISAIVTYSAGAKLVVVKDGTSVSVYYNNAKVGTTQPLVSPADDAIINGTLHGLFSTYSGNQLDNFLAMARGSNSEYSALDKWSGANP